MTSSQSQPTPSSNSIEELIAKLAQLEGVGDIEDKRHLTGEQIADVLWLTLELRKFETLSSEDENHLPEIKSDKSTEDLDNQQNNKNNKNKNNNSKLKKDDDAQKTKTSEKKGSVYTSSSYQESQGISINVPDAPSLSDPLNFARGFHPLMRQVATGRENVLDEAATVKKIAEELILTVVMSAEDQQWLDLALVIDESHSMVIWGHTIRELQQLLKKYGIFRDIRIFGLQPDEKGERLQVFSRTGNNNRLIEPKEIIDPTGRRVVFIVSDCVSNIWRKGMMFPVLKAWTQKQPLVILQMLPEWMWRRTALDFGIAVKFKSSIMGVANQQLSLYKPLRRKKRNNFPIEKQSKVPIISLEWETITQWSQMLVGKGDVNVQGYLLPHQLEIDHSLVKPQRQTKDNSNPTDIVNNFQRFTSPLGGKLASLLAAAPVISLPVVRLIKQSLLPGCEQNQIAEVFLGGILKPNAASVKKLNNNPDLNADLVEYEFLNPEIRDIFLDDAPVSDSIDVVNAVSRYIAEQIGVSISEFQAILKAPETLEEKEEQENVVQPFAEITAKVLRKLGGPYVKFADELDPDKNDNPPQPFNAPHEESFLTSENIRDIVQTSSYLASDEKIHQVMIVFKTSKQRTWLVSTNKQVFFLLDDENTRKSKRIIQLRQKLQESLPVITEKRKNSAYVFKLGNNSRFYYYSKNILGDLTQAKSKLESFIEMANTKKIGENDVSLKKLLFLSTNPKATTQLFVDEETHQIIEGLRRSKQIENFVIETVLAVSYIDVQRAIFDTKPNIVHFAGHGTEEGKPNMIYLSGHATRKGGRIVFEDETGPVNLVQADALARLFELFADSIECVVLNGCYSDVQAKAISQHIPYVVLMDNAIDDKAAIEFAVGFYDGLGAGKSVEFAYKLGCNSIEIAGIAEHLTPQLFSNPAKYPAKFFTIENLKAIMPNASDSDIATYVEPLNKVLHDFNLATTARACAFIAQIAHESGSLRYKEEIASGAAYEGRRDLGNTQPGDGKRFKGRGLIQLTGRANYRQCGQALNLPLEQNPELVVEDPYTNAAVAAWFWQTRKINQAVDQGNFKKVTRLINGGLNGYADRFAFWERAKRVFAELDYIQLRNLLENGNWQEADKKTGQLLLQITKGVDEGDLDTNAIDQLPCDDLEKIDQLWKEYSDGKFGFSKQNQIYRAIGGTDKYDSVVWKDFAELVGWFEDENWLTGVYSIDAPSGHLPFLEVRQTIDDDVKFFSRIAACNLNSDQLQNNQEIIFYKFIIKIVSGSLRGAVYKGFFSYDASSLTQKGKEQIDIEEIRFEYQENIFDKKGFDSTPKAHFEDGIFQDLSFVGGQSTQRFGLNSGFERNQFGRISEDFIHQGESYFGYLDANRYVDGAGTVTYRKLGKTRQEENLKQLNKFSENPFIPLMEPIKDYQFLFGREDIIETIFDILNAGGNVALVGEINTGKTSILKAIQQLGKDKISEKRKIIYLDLATMVEYNDFYYALCGEMGIRIQNNEPPTGYLFYREMKRHRILLLLDGIEQMTWEGFTLPFTRQLRSLADSFDPPFRLVVTANKPLTQLCTDNKLSAPFEGIFQEIHLQPWNKRIIREFIKLRLSQTNIQFTEEEVINIINSSQGNPGQVVESCHRLYNLKRGGEYNLT